MQGKEIYNEKISNSMEKYFIYIYAIIYELQILILICQTIQFNSINKNIIRIYVIQEYIYNIYIIFI